MHTGELFDLKQFMLQNMALKLYIHGQYSHYTGKIVRDELRAKQLNGYGIYNNNNQKKCCNAHTTYYDS